MELIGKIDPAKDFILGALAHKKHVVTANKDLLATHGLELTTAAKSRSVALYYEASVGGGIPILRTLSTHYLPDTITSISGIVNGTTNYMLTKMLTDNLSYEGSSSLKHRQKDLQNRTRPMMWTVLMQLIRWSS